MPDELCKPESSGRYYETWMRENPSKTFSQVQPNVNILEGCKKNFPARVDYYCKEVKVNVGTESLIVRCKAVRKRVQG